MKGSTEKGHGISTLLETIPNCSLERGTTSTMEMRVTPVELLLEQKLTQ